MDTLVEMAKGLPGDLSPEKAVYNFQKAVGKGLLKVFSKMGISTYMSYCGAQLFEAIGINNETIFKYFTGTPSRVQGIGVFEMAEKGLREVVNPSSLFLVDREQETTGTCVVPTIEGGRSILVEVQALVIKRTQEGGYAKRACVGWDKNRLDMILALLEARYGMPFSQADVYLNVAGGYRLDDPGTDMAVACAVMSAFLDKPMPRGMVAFGELALSGDVRPVAYMGLRIREAAKLGFESAWCPRLPDDASPSKGFQAKQTRGFHEIVNVLLGKS
jgi:DNA repair protein RadA/Sms